MTSPSSSSTPPQPSPPDTIASRPTGDDADAWRAYWQAQGIPWRTEREIPAERQAHLAERSAIKPDIEQGVCSFKDIKPSLTRA